MQTDNELRAELKSLGYKLRGKMKRETMLAKIVELRGAQEKPIVTHAEIATVLGPPNERVITTADGVVPFDVIPTPREQIGGVSQQQVLDICKDNIARGMIVSFVDNCWTFSLKGRMDCGTMSQPIYNIKKCADLITRESVPAAKLGLGPS